MNWDNAPWYEVNFLRGGIIESPKIKATVLPGGGDWLWGRPDGTNVMDWSDTTTLYCWYEVITSFLSLFIICLLFL
jgi:hypothetical protein